MRSFIIGITTDAHKRGIGGEWGNKQYPPREKVFLIKMQWNSKHIVPLPPLNPKLKDSTSGKSPKTCWTHLLHFQPMCFPPPTACANISKVRKTKNEKWKTKNWNWNWNWMLLLQSLQIYLHESRSGDWDGIKVLKVTPYQKNDLIGSLFFFNENAFLNISRDFDKHEAKFRQTLWFLPLNYF